MDVDLDNSSKERGFDMKLMSVLLEASHVFTPSEPYAFASDFGPRHAFRNRRNASLDVEAAHSVHLFLTVQQILGSVRRAGWLSLLHGLDLLAFAYGAAEEHIQPRSASADCLIWNFGEGWCNQILGPTRANLEM